MSSSMPTPTTRETTPPAQTLDPDRPKHLQIRTWIEGQIGRGDLAPGDRLPPTRSLAARLGVNRSTVVAAYKGLVEAGLADATVGRGTFVVAGVEPSPVTHPWQPVFSRAISSSAWHAPLELETIVDHPQPVDLAALAPDEELFPVEEFSRLMNRLLRDRGQELLQYGAPAGDPELRETIARELVRSGVEVTAERVVIVNGSQQGIDLTLRVLVDPGDPVVVESPTYISVLPTLGLYRAEILEVPVSPRGIDLDELARVVNRRRPKLIYVMPTFQNPTGITMDRETRVGLLEIAARHGIPILEDDYERDLWLKGARLPALAALDRAGLVVYLGTFSKGLFPGLRLGWIAAPEPMVEKLHLAKRAADLHTSPLLQAAVAAFCAGGHYRRHTGRLRQVYRERQAVTLAAAERCFPRGVTWTRPDGGFVVWVTMPEPLSARAVLEDARRAGVIATPGDYFFNGGRLRGGRGDRHLRLSFARATTTAIERGIEVLGDAMGRQLESGSTRRRHGGRTQVLPQL